MKKSLLLLLISFNVFSQKPIILNNNTIKTVLELMEINKGLKMLNEIRAFSNLEPLILNHELNKFAQKEADEFAKKEMYYFQKDGKGKSYYWKPLDQGGRYDYYTSVLALALNEEWAKKSTYNRMKCETCTSVGFGKAKSDTKHYFFVVYDSLR